MRPLTMIHTSDWHLGRTFYEKDRYPEHEKFLQWLFEKIQEHGAELLVVSGDLFDTASPSNRSLQLYSDFLCKVTAETSCQIVIVAGNHDSPSYLSALRNVFRRVKVHITGTAARPDRIQEEVFTLKDLAGQALAVVAAVPYLREGDIRRSAEGEAVDDRDALFYAGVQRHYERVTSAARSARTLAGDVPMILMGHLFTAGSRLSQRRASDDFYVGALGLVSPAIFSLDFDYVALGHLHIAQAVAGTETIRYSGAPLIFDFPKEPVACSCALVRFGGQQTEVEQLKIPIFQKIVSIFGTWPQLENQLDALIADGTPVWLEVLYTGTEPMPDLSTRVLERTGGTCVEPLRINFRQTCTPSVAADPVRKSLKDFTVFDVFEQVLQKTNYSDDDKKMLRDLYIQSITAVQNADTNAK
ncbi:MAG: exonuclease SbcCD subunit D C-terminal domain-containing protein [Planctomycetia bacterium]|nr:exonuclease SbcCD subunit D C-terminal domain-containing protein [Planctomycetia bacterium]